MTLHSRLEAAMRDAMRARDERRTTTLRMALAAAHNQRIARGRELTDEEVVEVIGREVKQRRESIEVYRGAGREDRAASEEAEVAILAEFLPEQLTDDEIDRPGARGDRRDRRRRTGRHRQGHGARRAGRRRVAPMDGG